ncbi:SRPBCC family protein [Planctomycetota bacterium]
MISSELSINIDAPPEKVFARIEDFESNIEWVPSLIEIKNVTGKGKGQTHQSVYKMMGIKMEMDVTVTEHVPNERLAFESGGGDGKMIYALEPLNDGCKLDVTYEYSVPIPLVGKIAEKLLKKRNEREFQTCLENLKELVEAGSQTSAD